MNAQDVRTNGDAILSQRLLGHSTGEHERRRQARAKVAAAAIIVVALIAHVPGVVAVARAHFVFKNAVVLGVLVAVGDAGTQRCAGGVTVEEAALNLHGVLFLARCSQRALAGSAARHFPGNSLFVQGESRRQSVQDNADGLAVGLTIN